MEVKIMKHKRCGFTLVELLVVIAIIGILVALLLPAVQAAREAARKAQCVNNMHQWGVGLLNHLDAKKQLPYGGAELEPTNRHTWVPQLWPYIECLGLAEMYSFDVGFYLLPNASAGVPGTPLSKSVPTYFCPSDNYSEFRIDYVKGNYALNWGHVSWPLGSTPNVVGDQTVRAPFGFMDFVSRSKPRRSRGKHFTDGLSKTMLMSEKIIHPQPGLKASPTDGRGDFFNDDESRAIYMTFNTPNASVPDYVKQGNYCVNMPEANLPCTTATSGGTGNHVAARSRHVGGVNVLMGDGSVHFVDENISLNTWQRISTMDDGKIQELSF
jgi:prepilin-type N-terminal cleavage/methylation domain-containing protein/prepilin-type processing-associated H-X9-DG protein